NFMAGAFDDALNSAPGVNTNEYDRQVFTWALYDRFRLMLEHFANATLPHLRVRVALSNWVWVPFTLEDVHVKIADDTTGQLLDEQIVPFSDRSEFDVGLMNVAPGRALRIWFKLGSHLSRVIQTTAQDGLLIGPLPLTPGDANGDNCVNTTDRT